MLCHVGSDASRNKSSGSFQRFVSYFRYPSSRLAIIVFSSYCFSLSFITTCNILTYPKQYLSDRFGSLNISLEVQRDSERHHQHSSEIKMFTALQYDMRTQFLGNESCHSRPTAEFPCFVLLLYQFRCGHIDLQTYRSGSQNAFTHTECLAFQRWVPLDFYGCVLQISINISPLC